MNILICDDNIATAKQIRQIIRQGVNLPCLNTFIYNLPQKMITDITENKLLPVDLILMDINLGEENGISLASKIQFYNRNIKIIFITEYENKYSQYIFKNVVPSGFITKPIKEEILISYIKKMYLESEEMCKPITIKTTIGEIALPANMITYIESKKRIAEYHVYQDLYIVYDKLDTIAESLPPCFVRCHKSYIANLNFVKQMDNSFFTLIDNTKLPISRRCKEHAREVYFKYKGIELV